MISPSTSNLYEGLLVPIPTSPLAPILIFSVKVESYVLNIKSADPDSAVQIALILALALHSLQRLNPIEQALLISPEILELIKLNAHNSDAPDDSPLNIATDDLLEVPDVFVPGPTCKGIIGLVVPIPTFPALDTFKYPPEVFNPAPPEPAVYNTTSLPSSKLVKFVFLPTPCPEFPKYI